MEFSLDSRFGITILLFNDIQLFWRMMLLVCHLLHARKKQDNILEHFLKQKQLHSTGFSPGKKMERVRSTFFMKYLRKCSKNTNFVLPPFAFIWRRQLKKMVLKYLTLQLKTNFACHFYLCLRVSDTSTTYRATCRAACRVPRAACYCQLEGKVDNLHLP
jgi:hypothetical protein